MKKSFKLVSMLALASSVFFSSCKKDEETPTVTAVASYSSVTLGAQLNQDSSYYSSASNAKFGSKTVDANISKVDITYAELGTGTVVPTLLNAAERLNNGMTKPTTAAQAVVSYFKESTAFDAAKFDTLTNEVALNTVSASSTKVSLASGKVYEFVSGTKKGLIKVTSLSSLSPSTATGSVTFSVKVQK